MSNSDRVNKGFLNRVRMLVLAVGDADLTDADTSQTLTIGKVPAGACLLGVDIRVATAFSGGGVTDVKAQVGDAGDVDGVVANADIDAATDGGASSYSFGISPFKFYAAATDIQVTVNSTGGNVSALTAGAMTVRVFYAIPGQG